jgi:hypothetical protein
MNPFEGAEIPVSAFAGDQGECPPLVASALAAFGNGDLGHREMANALVGTRVLLPTQAVLDSAQDVGGHEVEKESHIATAIFRADAGWSGLVVFTSVEHATMWNPDARLIPVTADQAAQTALEESCEALIVDFAGSQRVVLAGAPLRALAQSRQAVPVWRDHDVATEIEREARGRGVTVRMGKPDSDLKCDAIVWISADSGRAEAEGVVAQLAEALEGNPVLRDRLDLGLAFALTEATS